MKQSRDKLVLAEVRRTNPKKKRVTFFISTESKEALAVWCREQDITESGAIEAIIKTTVPARYFKGIK